MAQLSKSGEVIFEEDTPDEQIELGLNMLVNSTLSQFIASIEPMSVIKVDESGEQLVKAIEYELWYQIPDMPLPILGYIDVLQKDGIPLDIKTSKRRWPVDKAAKEIQPSFYLDGLRLAGMQSPGNRFNTW
jgi:hypothetical protein